MNQSYYRNVNPDLLDRIPLNAQAVVEVGCGTGALGGAYKLRNPQARYIGVEAMSEPAAQASGVLDRVIVGNAEDPHVFADKQPDVDCLVHYVSNDTFSSRIEDFVSLHFRTPEGFSNTGRVIWDASKKYMWVRHGKFPVRELRKYMEETLGVES